MATKTKFVCDNCGYESGKWYGRCPECGTWNSFQEIKLESKKGQFSQIRTSTYAKPQKIDDIKSVSLNRTSTGFSEFDRVLGGSAEHMGIVPGSVTLVSGDPGVGKSTLLLQLALAISGNGKTVLYVTGEESESQVKMRADRIDNVKKNKSNELFIYSTTDIDAALEICESQKPDLVIIDSIQTVSSTELPGFPGSIPQVRYTTSRLVAIAKREQIPVFLIGHVTKEGMVAGPMLLSHMVDTVLYLEGERLTGTRILRSLKNRFGDTSEVGIFIMEEKGMIELKDGSSFFMDSNDQKVPGACMTVVMEGSRPLLVEVQALCVPTSLTFARRVATGIPEKRLELLLAVLQKHVKIPVDKMDIFVNVVGGLKVNEPAVDLSVCLAIVSSFKSKALPSTVAIGEVGLLGEVKSVVNLDKRIKESQKLGFAKTVTVKDARFLFDVVSKVL
jgi:DNA repair protein RadA/Sms